MLYSCAINPSVCQLIKQPHYFQSIGPLIQLPSSEIKLLSKALIARLIPIDAVNDDMAVLMLIEDDEVDHLISMLTSTQLIPVISIMMDLCRSPHNMCAFASRLSIASMLSDIMDSASEDDQSKVAQLIRRLTVFNFESNEVSAVINNGTLHGLSHNYFHTKA